MKRYRSHKVVEAAKVARVEELGESVVLHLEGGLKGEFRVAVSFHYLSKHNPQVGGYYVRYADGYESWSPAKAFEEGYRLIDVAPHQERVAEERRQLLERLDLLSAFCNSDRFHDDVAQDERERLLHQRDIMQDYLQVLSERIANFYAAP